MWLLRLVSVVSFVSACGTAPAPVPATTAPTPVSPTVSTRGLLTVSPSVRIMSDAEWNACADCDGQSLEGGLPVVFSELPAVAIDGSLIAVAEERDGWGHVPHPGVRLLGRDGQTVQWLPVDARDATAHAQVKQANEALAGKRWLAIGAVKPAVAEVSESEHRMTLTLDTMQVTYAQRSDGDVWLAPTALEVKDAAGKVVVARTDLERAWTHNATCNLPSFRLVGANADARVVLFTTGLGMGGHNCDGVAQPPAWHVVAY